MFSKLIEINKRYCSLIPLLYIHYKKKHNNQTGQLSQTHRNTHPTIIKLRTITVITIWRPSFQKFQILLFARSYLMEEVLMAPPATAPLKTDKPVYCPINESLCILLRYAWSRRQGQVPERSPAGGNVGWDLFVDFLVIIYRVWFFVINVYSLLS